jgi:predicted nucleic acid-binding protein
VAVISILINSNAYSAFKRRNGDALSIIQTADRIGLSVIVLGELLHGFQLGRHEQRNRDELLEFLKSPCVEVVPIDRPVAERYARLRTQLRAIGKPIPTNDVWFAATALELGFAVYTLDAHFQVVSGLRVVAKLADLCEDTQH